MRARVPILACLFAVPSGAASMSPDVKRFVSIDAPVVAVTHVRVIDGTGRTVLPGLVGILSAPHRRWP